MKTETWNETSHLIPQNILREYKVSKEKYNYAWLGFDASTSIYFVSIIPYSWKKESLMIQKIEVACG